MAEPRPDDERPLVRFFRGLVQHPIGVLMMSIALLGMSLIATQRIPIELVPAGLSSSELSVRTNWEGANPQEIEQRILKPLEEQLRGITNLENLDSWAETGEAGVQLDFPGDVDMDQMYAEVSDRVERARPLLPPEVDRIRIRREGMNEFPVMFIGVKFPAMDRDTAQDLIADVMQPRLEAVDGVAGTQSWGLEPESVRIWLDEEQVFANRVDVGQLVQRLQGDNVSAPVGDLDDAAGRIIIRVDSRFESLEEIEQFPVRPGLLVKDIGRVTRVRSAPEFLFRFEGEYSTTVQVTKESSANTFALCEELNRVLEEEFPDDPVLGRFEYLVYFDQGAIIGQSLDDLIGDSLLGGGIACVVLLLFLRRISYTLLITLSIPFAVLIALSFLYFTGSSLNLMSMMGITISIGMLVDNSVVIVESIFKRREQGADTMESVSRGPAEVILAITTATLTTVVVFLPLMLLTEDRAQKIIATAIGAPLIVALIAALLLAVVMVPVAARFLQHRGRRKAGAAAAGHLPAWMLRPLEGSLKWSLAHRGRAVLLAGLILSSGAIPAAGRANDSDQANNDGQIDIGFELSEGSDLLTGHEEVQVIEQAVLLDPEFKERFPEVATGVWFTRTQGAIMVWPERPLKKRETKELLDYMKEKLPRRSALTYRFTKELEKQGSRDQEWTRIRVEGPENSGVQAVLADIRAAAEASEDFSEVSRKDRQAREIQVSLDRELMSRLGVDSQSVLGNIEWTMRGFMVSRFQTPHQDLPIIIEYDSPSNPDRASLEEMLITSPSSMVPLSTFAAFTDARASTGLWRHNGRIADTIGLKAETEDVKAAAGMAARLMQDIELPEGYAWSQAGGWAETAESMKDLQNAGILALGLVFFLMGLLFNSLILPLCALTTVFFAVLGANWAFFLLDQPFGPMEVLGVIVLVGVVVNNGIVLIDRILQLEREEGPGTATIVRAVRDRTRPVFMTALTTVCGLLPIALSEPTGTGMSFQGMAIGIVGGITVSTFFTLTVVPLAYSLLRDLGRFFAHGFSGRALPFATVSRDGAS
jgi:HAE1 family hydrophobic/amphiphilic exporter-1